MTREEREYFYTELKQMFAEWAKQFTPEEEKKYAMLVSTFEDRCMRQLTGQTPLPQDVFRMFLRQAGYPSIAVNNLYYDQGDSAPFYISITADNPKFAGVDMNNDTAVMSCVAEILSEKKSGDIQIVDLHVPHRDRVECRYLYFSSNRQSSGRLMILEYLWTTEGYYERRIVQQTDTGFVWNEDVVDAALSATSTNPVQNRVVTAALAGKADNMEGDTTPIVDVEFDVTEAMQTPNGELEALIDMYRQIREDSDPNNNPDLLSYYASMSGKKMVAHFIGTEQVEPDTGIDRDFIPLPWTIYLYNNRYDNNIPLLYIIFDYDTTQHLRDANVNDNLGISGDILGLVCSYEYGQFEYTTSTPWRQQ